MKYWVTDSRFRIILLVLFIMWLGVMVLFYIKAEEVTKDPCSICAKKMNEEVICSIGSSGKVISKTFYPNWTKIQVGG